MDTKYLVALAVIVVVGGGAYYFLGTVGGISDDDDSDTSTTAGMQVEENMVVVAEQKPGTSITGSRIILAAPGYLVIHEDNNGVAGAMLGASSLLPAGENTNVSVALSREVRDGEKLHAMLHFEKGNNQTFVAAEDTPVPSRLGGAISGWFEISSSASVNVPISI